MRRLVIAIALAVLFAIAAFQSNPVEAKLTGDRFTSDKWGISISAPKRWKLSESSSYPQILLWMTHWRPDARMLFTAEELQSSTIDALEYANITTKRLTELGFTVRTPQLHSATGAYITDFNNGQAYVRQAILLVPATPSRSAVSYSLTLSVKDSQTRDQMRRAFDYSLRSIRLEK